MGITPGGATPASFMSYGVAKRMSREGHKFGTGQIEGVIAPETAAHAAGTSALLPMLALGIPGSPTAAVLLGGLLIWGLQPGPLLFVEHKDFVWGLIASMYLGNLAGLVIVLTCVPLFAAILRIPFSIIAPIIIVICAIGAYSVHSAMLDIWFMMLFGVVGYLFKKLNYPLAPLVLALVLGDRAEDSFPPVDADIAGERGDFLLQLARGKHYRAGAGASGLAADLENACQVARRERVKLTGWRERQPVRAAARSLCRARRAAVHPSSGRDGDSLRRPRRHGRASRARACRRGLRKRRSRGGTGRQVLAGARALPCMLARGSCLSAAEHRLSKSELAYFSAMPSRASSSAHRTISRPSRRSRPEATVLTLSGDEGTLLDLARDAPETFDTVVSAPDDLAAILYTSGTTGRAKGAMLLPPQPGEQRTDPGRCLGLHARRRAAARAASVPRPRPLRGLPLRASFRQPHDLAAEIQRRRGDGAATACERDDGCPDVLYPLARRGRLHGRRLPLGETFHIGLGAAPSRNVQRISLALGSRDSRALRHERDGNEYLESAPRRAHLRQRGTAAAGSHAARGRRRRAAVLPGAIGGIEVKGPNVFAGYWRMPDRTRDEFTADGFFKTGDMGELLDNGYLKIVGRAKDLIITGGLNVYPKEIEERIDALPGIAESAVIGVPDPDFGEAVTAVVVAKAGHAPSEADLIAALKAEIANFKVPKRVHFVDELPRNAMGKVEKNTLRQRYSVSSP